ncbi:hypothetical protein TEA_024203 [Camellia sinensis var. sinensis]|uniref:Uncharacterized protein n=1 Tax=Camellia sinensis var. sinensis TaxID=542762 RepID=A0A4S4DWA3_CAMSN|nr:hypothetical protein TEA_024203 [Camellia sinensis var. sinensis]
MWEGVVRMAVQRGSGDVIAKVLVVLGGSDGGDGGFCSSDGGEMREKDEREERRGEKGIGEIRRPGKCMVSSHMTGLRFCSMKMSAMISILFYVVDFVWYKEDAQTSWKWNSYSYKFLTNCRTLALNTKLSALNISSNVDGRRFMSGLSWSIGVVGLGFARRADGRRSMGGLSWSIDVVGFGLARKLSMEQDKFMTTLDGPKKILDARGKVRLRQGGSQWSMVAHDRVCAGGLSWT